MRRHGLLALTIAVSCAATAAAQPGLAARGASPAAFGATQDLHHGLLGRIDFPTSASPAAQPHFIRGVAALHSFEYEEAVEAFRRARELDPGFALAYWGEALAHHSTLARSTDLEGARAVLGQLAPTREARLARAPTAIERGLLDAVEALFGDGDESDRQQAYVSSMAQLYGRFPDDTEVASFYALALLDTAIRATFGLGGPAAAEGHQHVRLAGSDTQRIAGEILRRVLKKNPEHPGAAHYLLHNQDDPEHAAQALDVARTYSRIAPASSHALHMPAHIFLQLGLWHDAAVSDEAASNAAAGWARRKGLDEARYDYHPLTWLQYERLQLGQYGRAQEMLQAMQDRAARTGAPLLKNHAASMRARYVVETRRWELLRDGDDFGNLDELVAIGFSAARAGNAERAGQVGEVLSQFAERPPPGSPIAPALAAMAREVAALVHLAAGRRDDAVAALRQAVEAELRLPTGMGPPRPIKPAQELLGEVLLEMGRPAEARAEFERALLRFPNRSASVLGLARSAAAMGDRAGAARRYEAFLANWSTADPGLVELKEARDAIGSPASFAGPMAGIGIVALIAGLLVTLRRRNRRPAQTRRRGIGQANAPRTARRGKPLPARRDR